MTKAVLFDFDETLQDRTAAFEKYMDAFLDKFCPEISESERLERKQDMRTTGKGGYVDREKWYASLIEKWNWQSAPSPQVLAQHYDYTFGDHNAVFPESKELLIKLRDMGLKTGVITNGPSHLQNHKMDCSGLRPYCDIVIVSGDVGIHKPSPKLFKYAAEKLGLEPEECVYVGDHPINDIRGAAEAGMKAIRMNFGWFKGKALKNDIPTIEKISDVIKYI